MKKILYILVAFTLFVNFTNIQIVQATNFTDLSAMTIDELFQVNSEIIKELLNRSDFSEIEVPMGTYLVGRDIPAGSYEVQASGMYISLDIYPNKENQEQVKKGMTDMSLDSSMGYLSAMSAAQSFFLSDKEIIGKLDLEEGNVVSLSSGGIILKLFTGLKITKH